MRAFDLDLRKALTRWIRERLGIEKLPWTSADGRAALIGSVKELLRNGRYMQPSWPTRFQITMILRR